MSGERRGVLKVGGRAELRRRISPRTNHRLFGLVGKSRQLLMAPVYPKASGSGLDYLGKSRQQTNWFVFTVVIIWKHQAFTSCSIETLLMYAICMG
jgi:hypothetical protein